MNRGQTTPYRSQPEDVGISTPRSSAAMPQPPTTLPSGPTIARPFLTNHTSLDILNRTSSNNSAGRAGTFYLNRHLSEDLTTPGSTTEDYGKLKDEFYQSYDPQVGLHTAAVLGGILGWLIVYLLYKTKVKKVIAKLVRKKCKIKKQKQQSKKLSGGFAEYQDKDPTSNAVSESFGQEEKNNHLKEQLQRHLSHPEYLTQQADRTLPPPPPLQGHLLQHPEEDRLNQPMCGQQGPMPSIVVESYSTLTHTDTIAKTQTEGQDQLKQADNLPHHHRKARRKSGCREQGHQGGGKRSGKEKRRRHNKRRRSRSHGQQCPEVMVLELDEPNTSSLLLPPCAEDDSARATARWVQTMPLLMQSQHDVTGLILRIQPNMVGYHKQHSCPLISAALGYAALPLLGLPNIGLNNSMPHLALHGGGGLRSSNSSLNSTNRENKITTVTNNDRDVLQPLTSTLSESRPQSFLSCPETSQTRPAYSRKSPPCLSIPILIPDDKPMSSSSMTNLAVPLCGMSRSAPASPVPIPVTPTVTIQNSTSRAHSRLPASLRRCDSQDSASSSSSLDPLLQLQHKCDCLPQEQLPPFPHQPYAKAAPSTSWTVFSVDNDEEKSGGRGGGGSSRPNSNHSKHSPAPSGQPSGTEPLDMEDTAPSDAIFTLETKL